MSLTLSFHPLVQRDFNEILAYYEEQATPEVADRFEAEFRVAVASIKAHLRQFPFYLSQRRFRRCLLDTFPHVVLYRETSTGIRIMILKHVKRAPGFGLSRH